MPIVVISGGSSGIGLACVKKFLQQDNYTIYNLDINPSNISHNNYHYIQADMSDSNQIKQAIKQILTHTDQINSLIISAGIHLSATIEATTDAMLMQIVNLNLLGAFWLIQGIIPHMKNSGGSIITIGSDQSLIAKNNSAAYGMTKAGLASLTKSTALDYAKYNIRANCIGAGTIDTPLYRQAIAKYANKSGINLQQIEQEEQLAQPVGRIGEAYEVAELAYFLAGEWATFITGAIIPIDGGYTTR